MKAHHGIIGPITVVLAAGCYNYSPVATTPQPGHSVRAEISDRGSGSLTAQLGPGVTQLEGLLLNADTQGVSILVQSYVTRHQGTLAGTGEAVRLQPDQIRVLEEKRLNRPRSFLLAAALAATAVLAIEVFGPDGLIFADEENEDPGPPTLRAPRGLRIPLRAMIRMP
jgi:hypothetical protein